MTEAQIAQLFRQNATSVFDGDAYVISGRAIQNCAMDVVKAFARPVPKIEPERAAFAEEIATAVCRKIGKALDGALKG